MEDEKETKCLTEKFIVKTLADRYNELLTLLKDEHYTNSGKRDLEAKGDLIEEIAYDLNLGEAFNKQIHGNICWKGDD